MKTNVLIIAVLVCGGLLITSCQKDNALIEDTDYELVAENQQSPKTGPWSGEHDQGDISSDVITNFPDPFVRQTTITYVLTKYEKWVNLSIYKKGSTLVGVLVDGPQNEGRQFVKFDARELPDGTYTAVLKIGAKVYQEELTKVPYIQEEKDGPASDL